MITFVVKKVLVATVEYEMREWLSIYYWVIIWRLVTLQFIVDYVLGQLMSRLLGFIKFNIS